MRLFSKNKEHNGYIAVRFQERGSSVAYVRRVPNAKPVVELARFYPKTSPDSAASLDVISKDIQVSQYKWSTLLGHDEYQLLSVEAPNVPQDELKTAIRWRLKDLLDYHIDDATIDVLDIPADKNASARAHAMYAVAARNQLIGQRQALFSEAKIPLSVIDIPEMAQRNISALVPSEGRGIAMLSFDNTGGLLTVTFAEELYLSRRLDVGRLQLSEAEGEQRESLFERITLELQRSLDHFERQYHFIAVAKLLLAPVAEIEHNLKSYLESNLYIPIEIFAVGDVLDISRVPELSQPEKLQDYLMTLGAALRFEETAL